MLVSVDPLHTLINLEFLSYSLYQSTHMERHGDCIGLNDSSTKVYRMNTNGLLGV